MLCCVDDSVITETAHEGITAIALARLAPAEIARFNAEKLRVGVIWDDMPVGVDGQDAKAVKDGRTYYHRPLVPPYRACD